MILVINPGSSSLKYKLFLDNMVQKSGDFEIGKNGFTKNFEEGVEKLLEEVSQFFSQIEKIGIRVVHGGSKFSLPTLVTDEVISCIEEHIELAPLHNPPALSVIKKLLDEKKETPLYAIFDTAFFINLPPESNTYAIDQTIAEKYQIKRYGFHGISHKYASEKADPYQKLRIVVIHLGAGASISAVESGRPVATSMGMTPLEGLVMQTRCGDIDAGVVLLLAKEIGISGTREMLEKHSGLSGLTDTDGSMVRMLQLAGEKVEGVETLKENEQTDPKDKREVKLALKIYINQIVKYIGAYAALMEGVDKIVFTGKIGFKSPVIREMVMKKLEFLCKDIEVVEPDEELAIAEELTKL